MMAAHLHTDGHAVGRHARYAMGGPGAKVFTHDDVLAIRDRILLIAEREGLTTAELAAAFERTPRWVKLRRAAIRRFAARCSRGAGGAA